jgi:transposase
MIGHWLITGRFPDLHPPVAMVGKWLTARFLFAMLGRAATRLGRETPGPKEREEDRMTATATTPCANCERLQEQLSAQQTRLDSLNATVAELQATLAQVQTQLAAARKNSSTSSKPPSSDIVKPPKPAPPPGQDKRSIGGQPGHPKHERARVPPELLTAPPHDYLPEICPDCGLGLLPAGDEPRIVQQIELPVLPILIEEHRSHPGWCPHCCKVHYGALPAVVERGGLAGPRLTTLIAYLKGVCHASYTTIRKFLRDVVQLTLSRSQSAKIIAKVSAALEQPYQELLDDLPNQPRLNVDETGHKQSGDRMWTWCFRASLYTLFKIDPTRSGDVLIKVLGEEFKGVLGCDYFSAYRRYMKQFEVVVQFCLAHLIRDVKFLGTLPDVKARAYGERLREALRSLFAVIHQKEHLAGRVFQERLVAAREEILRVAREDVPASKHCQNLAKRFAKHGTAYFQFMTTPGVEPTNNLAEQAIRFVVLDRVVTQGTRSAKGNRWCERIWTVIASCAQQGRSVFDYLYEAVVAYWHKGPAPSLLPNEGAVPAPAASA